MRALSGVWPVVGLLFVACASQSGSGQKAGLDGSPPDAAGTVGGGGGGGSGGTGGQGGSAGSGGSAGTGGQKDGGSTADAGLPDAGRDAARDAIPSWVTTGTFRWKGEPAFLAIDRAKLPPSPGNEWFAVKDPSMVYFQGRWHLFSTLRKTTGSNGQPPGYIRIGYLSFTDWSLAQSASWQLLELYNPGDAMGYHGAPQVFYFAPQKKWYLVYQLEDAARGIPYGGCYSTTSDISDAKSWTLLARLWPPQNGIPSGLDNWIICDDQKCHHFYSNLDGTIWRADTALADFPAGWSTPVVAVRGNIFEATHTYKIRGVSKYLTIADTQGDATVGERYQTAYIADRLDGPWQAFADTKAKSFASLTNTTFAAGKWTNTIDHGELVRTGYDQQLEIDPADLRWVYQGKTGSAVDFKLGILSYDY